MAKSISPSELNELEKLIDVPASKANTLIVSNHIIQHPHLLDVLYHIIWNSKETVQWRASWVFEHVFLINPILIHPYIDDMIEQFSTIKSNGVKRHFAKILSLSPIAEKVNGDMINVCFDWLTSASIPVAIKAHCMQILYNITATFPELKQELKTVIEEQLPYNSVGFKSRAKQLLKKL